MKLISTPILFACLSALHLSAAGKVNLIWRPTPPGISDLYRFRSERLDPGQMGGSAKSLEIPLTFDGKVAGSNTFWVYVLKDATTQASTTIVECTIVGQLKAGLEETTFKFQDSMNFLEPCRDPDGLAVVCENPIKADCTPAFSW